MTAAAYTWPKYSIMQNGGFAAILGSWTAVGTAAYDGTKNNGVVTGAGSVKLLANQDAIYQTVTIKQFDTTTDPGRWISEDDYHWLSFYAWRVSSSPNLVVTLSILDGSSNVVYAYDWHAGKWVPRVTEASAPQWWAPFKGTGAFERFVLPRIAPVGPVDSAITDSYKLRLRFTQASAGQINVDDVQFTTWPGNIHAEKVGPYTVISNGFNVPVKYDPRSNTVTELSLVPPYAHTAIPTATTSTTGGEIPDGHYVGFSYAFKSDDTGEESGAPFGNRGVSGYFYQQVGSSADTNKITLDFSAIEIPNMETAKGTNNTQVDKIVVYRTINSPDENIIKAALFNGDLFHHATIALAASTDVTADNPDITSIQSDQRFEAHVMEPMPGFKYMRSYRSRLFVAGGQVFERGKVATTSASNKVVGVDEDDASNAPTLWNRNIEGHWLRIASDTSSIPVERYIYKEDDGASADEKLYLTAPYGTTISFASYKAYPEGGRVFYSDENQPWGRGRDNLFSIDGGEGGDVTGLLPAGKILLIGTRRETFAFTWDVNPVLEGITEAAPISRSLGCISHDSWAEIDGFAYWLSDRGPVRWREGMPEPQLFGGAIQAVFTDPNDPDYILRDKVSLLAEDAQGVHYPARQQYLLAVRTKASRGGCDLVLVYNYFFDTWDFVRVRNEIVRWSWAVDDAGADILLCTDTFGATYRWDSGETDGAGTPTLQGRLRGVATAVGTATLSDSAADFYDNSNDPSFSTDALDLDGAYVEIVAGPGVGQIRRIEANTTSQLIFSQPWVESPVADESIYEIGGIDFRWRSKFGNLGAYGRPKHIHKINVDHKRETLVSQPTLAVYSEFNEDISWAQKKAIVERTFSTAADGRSMVPAEEAAGYNLAIEIENNGPNAPLEIRGLSIQLDFGKQDQ